MRQLPPIFLVVAILATIACSHLLLSLSLTRLGQRLSALSDDSTMNERTELSRGIAELAAERARISHLLNGRSTASRNAALPTASTVDASKATDRDRSSLESPSQVDASIAAIDALPQHEYAELLNKRDHIQPSPPQDVVLLQQDIDGLITDPNWNPESIELTPEQKGALGFLLKQYKHFARTAVTERVDRLMRPEIESMRQSGAYVEYEANNPEALPLPVQEDGVTLICVSGPADNDNLRRLYYFYPHDYPEIYHQARVEAEQSLKLYISIYELLNGPLRADQE